jgi:hypothetical protein
MPQGMNELAMLPNYVMNVQQPCQILSFNNVQGGNMRNILAKMQYGLQARIMGFLGLNLGQWNPLQQMQVMQA